MLDVQLARNLPNLMKRTHLAVNADLEMCDNTDFEINN